MGTGCALLALSLIVLSFFRPVIPAGEDALVAGEAFGVDGTLVSLGKTFAFGFFKPGNSKNQYLGIWYNKIPGETVIWVANRENPVTDSSGVVAIAAGGNLLLSDGSGKTLWSSNVSLEILAGKNTSAVLQESGNLVLMDEREDVLWQSFDNPSDTYLPGMKFRLNLTSGETRGLVSWRDAGDPSRGEYSVRLDPLWPAQLLLSKGSTRLWRSTWWNGRVSTELLDNGRNYASYLTVVTSKDEMILTIALSDASLVSRIVLNRSGLVSQLTWTPDSASWDVVWTRPFIPCHFYAHCGPFGVCNRNKNPECECLEGFKPKNTVNWDNGNFSEGCVRRIEEKCNEGDGFQRLVKIKLPDLPTSFNNLNITECQSQCLKNCSCEAFSYANVTFGQSPRCLLWGRNLMDMESNYTTGQEIFIRLAKDELDDLNGGGADKNKHLVAILVPTAAAGLLIFVMFVYFIWRRHKRQGRREAERGFRAFINGDSIPDLPLFSFTGILAATENFSTANKLGEGGFGPVYKGKLPKGREVAIKRLSKTSGQGLEEFKNEVELIAKLQHKNLVRLLGWCIHGHEKILIYEFMANKSLDKFLFDPTGQVQLDWGRRFCIAEGIAQGLLYLHRYSRLRVIHRDLKPSNILLDSAMNPKISDFGLARIFGGNQTAANTNRVVGTYGYMSPEYALDGLFSEKSDVFSFGVILLEIVSGKRSTGFYPFKHSLNLLGYAWLLWREDRSSELLDPTILDSCIIHEVSRCIHVGLLCVQEDARDRPDMSSVVCMLNNHRATLPSPKQPAFSVSKAPASSDSSSSSASLYFSINDVTITTLGPRPEKKVSQRKEIAFSTKIVHRILSWRRNCTHNRNHTT